MKLFLELGKRGHIAKRRLLAFAMPDFRSHTPFFPPEFTSPLAGLLYSHATKSPLLKKVEMPIPTERIPEFYKRREKTTGGIY